MENWEMGLKQRKWNEEKEIGRQGYKPMFRQVKEFSGAIECCSRRVPSSIGGSRTMKSPVMLFLNHSSKKRQLIEHHDILQLPTCSDMAEQSHLGFCGDVTHSSHRDLCLNDGISLPVTRGHGIWPLFLSHWSASVHLWAKQGQQWQADRWPEGWI